MVWVLQFSDVKLKEQSIFVTVNETLDSILDESGDEEEQDAVVNQVLDEIGIEISGKVSITAIFVLPFFVFHQIAGHFLLDAYFGSIVF